MAIRFKEKFERDYDFYLNNRHKFRIAGCVIPAPDYDENGLSAKEVFWYFDSQGKLKPCREPELFVQLLTCKKAINLQIKMWADGQDDCLIPITELMESFEGQVPDWVEVSLRNQIEKSFRKKYGG